MKPAQLGQDTVIYDRNGQRIAELYGAVNRVVVKSDQIPAVMKNATVAIEDRRFYQHHGVDFTGIARALVDDLKAGHVVQGASTITEQYVKNAYIGDDPTLTRKLREAVLAWELEDRWSKDQILTAYLNTVYYGAGAYGVAGGLADLLPQAGRRRVTLPQAPCWRRCPSSPAGTRRSPTPRSITQRRNLVLDDMAAAGLHHAGPGRRRQGDQAARLRQAAARPRTRRPTSSTTSPASSSTVRRPRDLRGRPARLHLARHAHAGRRHRRPQGHAADRGQAGALVSIDPANGYIRAMAASTDYKTYKFDLAWQAHRQLGSTMKPFALIAAVEQGADPATTFYNSQPLHIYLGPGAVPPYWDVFTSENSSGGRINLVQATWQSDNTVYAQLCLDLGPDADRQGGPQDGHHEPADARCPRSCWAARTSTRSRWPTPTPPSPARASATRRRRSPRWCSRTARSSRPGQRQPRAPGRRGLRGRQDPREQHALRRHGGVHAQLLRRPLGRQDRHHRPTTPTPGSAASTPSWPPPCGWAIRRPRSRCRACTAPPTRADLGHVLQHGLRLDLHPRLRHAGRHAGLEAVEGQVLEDGALAVALAVAVTVDLESASHAQARHQQDLDRQADPETTR